MDSIIIYSAHPATGVLYITEDNLSFISGHVRMRGKDEGRYPFHYLRMIENLFGYEAETIEVCSRYVNDGAFTVDIDRNCGPMLVTDGETLAGIEDQSFNRWRCDPPYNEKTAREMYHCPLPNIGRLLQAGARVVRPGSLMFLLLGPQNYQWTPPGVVRIGWIAITIVPNNELRALHIYLKLDNPNTTRQPQYNLDNANGNTTYQAGHYQSQLRFNSDREDGQKQQSKLTLSEMEM